MKIGPFEVTTANSAHKHKQCFELISQQLTSIHKQGEKIMSKLDEITAQLDAIDTQTNEIAADIDKLIAGGLVGLSEAEAQAVIDRLTTTADTLRTIAAKA